MISGTVGVGDANAVYDIHPNIVDTTQSSIMLNTQSTTISRMETAPYSSISSLPTHLLADETATLQQEVTSVETPTDEEMPDIKEEKAEVIKISKDDMKDKIQAIREKAWED